MTRRSTQRNQGAGPKTGGHHTPPPPSDGQGIHAQKSFTLRKMDGYHVASYAELAMLMSPRPFMVEQGHRDGGAPTEWGLGEYGKVRRHYDQLKICDQTEIEFFDGSHTINGKGTLQFLHRHLNWLD